MRNILIVVSLILACIVFCLALADSTMNAIDYPYLKNNDSIRVVYTIGVFAITLITALYGIYQYEEHKEEEKTKLLYKYNERYSTDKNIEAVIKFILNNSVEDESGELKPINRFLWKEPSLTNEKEMFMRFFEELQMQIKNKQMDSHKVCSLFSYYAIEFDKNPEFRIDITDYKSEKELNDLREKIKKESDNKKIEELEERIREYSFVWKDFRAFATNMAELRNKLKNDIYSNIQ